MAGTRLPQSAAVRSVILGVIFAASGAPGLAAQLAWVRLFSAGLGHEWPALIGVVSTFFAGMAAGAWLLDRRISRSSGPVRWYAGLEGFSALWIALWTPFLPSLNRVALSWTGLDPAAGWQAAVSFLVPLVAIGPAAAAMGASLPAMDRALAPLLPDRRAIAVLYTLNTLGAMVGVILAVGWWMPNWGLSGTLRIAAALQVICALGAWGLEGTARTESGSGAGESASLGSPSGPTPRRLQGIAAGAGFLGIAYELVGIRLLAHLTENTVQTYASALVIFLAGTAGGGAWIRWRERRGGGPCLGTLLACQAAACAGATWALATLGRYREVLQSGLGIRGAEWLFAAVLFLVPTVMMGAIFGTVVQGARRPEGGVGRAVAWNTLGCAGAGPIAAGILLPLLGGMKTAGMIPLGYAALLPGPWRLRRGAGWCLLGAAWIALPSPTHWISRGEGERVVRFMEGRMASVAVLQSADGHRVLRVNGHFQQGGTATAGAAQRHAHLPLLLHPDPRRALFLGVGTGITLGAATTHPQLKAEGVELLPEIVRVLDAFEPENAAPQRHPRVSLRIADARRFVRISTNAYDVIVADLFHPSEDGAGFLYTREHFAAIRARLAPGGVVCQWLPLHQLGLPDLAVIARTFLEVFPDAELWLLRMNIDVPVVGLVAGEGARHVSAGVLERRLREAPLRAALTPLALGDAVRVLGCRLASAPSLRQWAGTGEVATDDRPVVLFRAAAWAYASQDPPAGRLLTLLGQVEPDFGSLLVSDDLDRESWLRRLSSFRVARDLHVRGLHEESQGRRDQAVELYLESVRASSEYTAGYAQALLVASAYARVQPAGARAILEALKAARPEQKAASDLLERLDRNEPAGNPR